MWNQQPSFYWLLCMCLKIINSFQIQIWKFFRIHLPHLLLLVSYLVTHSNWSSPVWILLAQWQGPLFLPGNQLYFQILLIIREFFLIWSQHWGFYSLILVFLRQRESVQFVFRLSCMLNLLMCSYKSLFQTFSSQHLKNFKYIPKMD